MRPNHISQVFPDYSTGVHAGLQTVKSLIQAHLGATHEYQFRHHAFGPKQIRRFCEEGLQKILIAKIESLVIVRSRRINSTIKIVGESDQSATSRGRQTRAGRPVIFFHQLPELDGMSRAGIKKNATQIRDRFRRQMLGTAEINQSDPPIISE
jgi:hypothetical protein